MNFLNPAFFWSLLALIPLGLVYLMKTRPRKRVTNALFLWQKILEEKASKFWIRKLRNMLSLLIMALATVFICLSLVNPRLDNKKQKDLLIIIDASASMMTQEGGKSRFDNAKALVSKWLLSVEGGNRVALASVSDKLQYHCHLTSNTRLVRDALEEVTQSPLPLRASAMAEINMFAVDQTENAAPERDYRILFLTDRASEMSDYPEGVEVVSMAESADNIGIVSADLAYQIDGSGKLFFTLTSTLEEDVDAEIEFRHLETGRVAKLITVNIPAGAEKSEVIEVEEVFEGLWELAILGEDSFPVDDKVFLGLNIPAPIPVSIGASDSYFYERSIEAFATADNLLTLAPVEHSTLVITEGESSSDSGAALIFSPVQNSVTAPSVGEALPSVIAEEVVKNHPLTKYLNLELLRFNGAVDLKAPDGAIVILREIGGTPLLYTLQTEGGKSVVWNFDPSAENFFLSPWFPVIVHNAARYLGDREAETPAVVRVGSTVTAGAEGSPMQAEHFGGNESDALVESRSVRGGAQALRKLGGYVFSESQSQWFVGSSLLSVEESKGGVMNASEDTFEPPPSGFPIAWYLLFFGALALLLEEFLYHRRKVG